MPPALSIAKMSAFMIGIDGVVEGLLFVVVVDRIDRKGAFSFRRGVKVRGLLWRYVPTQGGCYVTVPLHS